MLRRTPNPSLSQSTDIYGALFMSQSILDAGHNTKNSPDPGLLLKDGLSFTVMSLSLSLHAHAAKCVLDILLNTQQEIHRLSHRTSPPPV